MSISGRRLYLCTPDRPDLDRFLADAIAGGVDVVQLRDKELGASSIVARARTAASVCRDLGVPFVVNDRPDVALESGADGVHVGQDDVSPATARTILGPTALVGLSTHAPGEAADAVHEPVDYVSAGPVVPTPTKPGRLGTGVGYIAEAVRMSGDRPVFVTGGVDPHTVAGLAKAGARHFVVVRFLTQSTDVRGDASRLRRAVDDAVEQAEQADQAEQAEEVNGAGARATP